MSSRESLLEKLVASQQLGMPERQRWGPSPVKIEEILAIVKRLLDRDGVFPVRAKKWNPGEPVFEGHFLVKIPNGEVELNWQRSLPIAPNELAEQFSSVYDSADRAVLAFIQNEWPRGIDGITFEGLGQT